PMCLLDCSKARSLRVDVSCMEKISTAVTSARPPPPGGCLGRPASHELLPERRLVLPLHLEDVHAAVLALDLDVRMVGVRGPAPVIGVVALDAALRILAELHVARGPGALRHGHALPRRPLRYVGTPLVARHDGRRRSPQPS